jgi:hypothetical protein
LLRRGFFNPSRPGGGFDEAFMLSMARHGFDQGTEWEPGEVDSMNFELVEIVETLSQPEGATKKVKWQPISRATAVSFVFESRRSWASRFFSYLSLQLKERVPASLTPADVKERGSGLAPRSSRPSRGCPR